MEQSWKVKVLPPLFTVVIFPVEAGSSDDPAAAADDD